MEYPSRNRTKVEYVGHLTTTTLKVVQHAAADLVPLCILMVKQPPLAHEMLLYHYVEYKTTILSV